MPYLCKKKLSKSRSNNPSFGLFWVISEPGSPDYITYKILAFLATFLHEITLTAKDIDKNSSSRSSSSLLPQSIKYVTVTRCCSFAFITTLSVKKSTIVKQNNVFSRLDIFQCESRQLVEEQFRVLFLFDIFWQGGKLSTGPPPKARVGD